MDPFQAPDASVPNDSSPALDAALRALTLLLIAYAGTLGASIIGGALRAHFMTQLWTNRSSGAAFGDTMTLVFGAFYLFHLLAAGVVLLGLLGLTAAPPQARVSGLAWTALGLLAVSLGISVLSYVVPRFASQLLPSATLEGMMRGIGYLDTVLDLAGTVLLIESLLRLRRYSAPDDRAVAASESTLRGALIGLFVARVIVDHLSYFFRSALNATFGTSFWPLYFVRALLTLLFIGTLIHLIQATAKALRLRPRTAATGGDTAASASAEKANQGYRNMIFGALWAIGGIAVTALTYQQASSSGGRYMVAYGAIIFGALQFIRGLVRVLSPS